MFSKAGYLVEDFGTGTVIVRECPMLISGDDIEDTIVEMALYLSENRTNIESEKIDRIHHTSACKAAIKAGYKNSTAEMKVLAEAVLYDEAVRYCPHGRPVAFELKRSELEKQFEDAKGKGLKVRLNDENIIGVNFSKNFGQHGALMAGFHQVTGDILVCLDDDGQTPANEVGKLLEKIEELTL